MTISKTESDVILNRANVALARSQRLVASWLPEKTADELATAKSEEELQREEDEIFTAVPETLGVGAPLPEKAADGSWNRTELSSNDQLRKQLLGRNYDKFMKASAAAKQKQAQASAAKGGNGGGISSSTGLGLSGKNNDDDDDDEEDGRVSMVGQKNKKKRRKVGQSVSDGISESVPSSSAAATGDVNGEGENGGIGEKGHDGNGPLETAQPAKPAPSKAKKKATSYLDELLAERSKKRKKR